MYGNDLSSRSRTLNGGRWRLTRFCSRWSASASLWVTITSIRAIRSTSWLDPGARVAAAVEVAAHAGPERLRLADVEDLVALVAKEVDARARAAAVSAAPERNLHARELAYPPPCGAILLTLLGSAASCSRARAARARAAARRWRSAPPRTSSARPTSSRAKAKMTPAAARRLHRRPRHVALAARAASRRPPASCTILRNVEAAAQLSGVQGLRLGLPPGLARRRRSMPAAQDEFAAVHGRARARSCRPSTT